MKKRKLRYCLPASVLLLLITLFCTCPARAIAQLEHQYEHYVIIDGVEYDALYEHNGKTSNGGNWYYHPSSKGAQVDLQGYQGGQIASNLDLYVWATPSIELFGDEEAPCIVRSSAGCGIYSSGNVEIQTPSAEPYDPFLSVEGASGYPAVYAEKEFTLIWGLMEAQGGGNAPALQATSIHYDFQWPTKTYAGDNSSAAQETEYHAQPYVKFVRETRTMTLFGNGGITDQGAISQTFSFRDHTHLSGGFDLAPGQNLFHNGSKLLLGWTDTPDWSGKFWYSSQPYNYPDGSLDAHLYAAWEDASHKGVVLHNFYGYDYFENLRLSVYGESLVKWAAVGELFTLPQQTRAGYTFDGWRSETGDIYGAGEQITISNTTSFTATFSPQVLKIDGQIFDTSANHSGPGWIYSPGRLSLTTEYSGLPIEIPTDITIDISSHGSPTQKPLFKPVHVVLQRSNAVPSIWCHGNMDLFMDANCVLERTGSSSMPGIRVDGRLYIQGDHGSFLRLEGSPAIRAARVRFSPLTSPFYIGTNWDSLHRSDTYQEDYCFLLARGIENAITGQGSATLPEGPPFYEDRVFMGWHDLTYSPVLDHDIGWYLPGDQAVLNQKTALIPRYIFGNPQSVAPIDLVGVILDGNGIRTARGGNYNVYFDSASDQKTATPLSADVFSDPGQVLTGFSTGADGSGARYLPGECISTEPGVFVYRLYAQWSPLLCSGQINDDLSWNLSEDRHIVLSGTIPDGAKVITATYGEDHRFLDAEIITQTDIPVQLQQDGAILNLFLLTGQNTPVCKSNSVDLQKQHIN